jgi:hypothetical protein
MVCVRLNLKFGVFMKNKTFTWAVPIIALMLATGASVQAQSWGGDRLPERFSGQINAYTPTTTKAPTGPYEIRGPWSLKLNREGTKGEFSAAVNMVLSDGWVLTNSGANGNGVPPNFDPAGRNAHTHNITMTGDVTKLATGGFQVMGTATVTLNGGITPFAQQSPLTIVVTGATTGIAPVEFSNITLLFGAPASGHFGGELLPGVVRHVRREGDR